MNENITINIKGIEPDIVSSLENKYNNIKTFKESDSIGIQLEISKSFHKSILINTLDEFLDNFNSIKKFELTSCWFFDEKNSLIEGPKEIFLLTTKEVLFLKMLIQSKRIITYNEMLCTLWRNGEEVSKNAMRLFTRNIKKKLPPNILKNFQNRGYKLVI